MQNHSQQFQFRAGGFFGLIFLVLFFVMLFFLAKGIFTILSWAAPVLIIAALLINYQTVLGFLKYLWKLLLRKPLAGILAIILSVLGFPIVSGFLFGKAILDRRVKRIQSEIRRHHEGELVDYEEVREGDAEVLDINTLPPAEKRRNTYEQFFDEDEQRRT